MTIPTTHTIPITHTTLTSTQRFELTTDLVTIKELVLSAIKQLGLPLKATDKLQLTEELLNASKIEAMIEIQLELGIFIQVPCISSYKFHAVELDSLADSLEATPHKGNHTEH